MSLTGRLKTSKEELAWHKRHLPTCYCRKQMFLSDKGYFFCPSCGREVKLLAAGAELRKLNNMDLHRITIRKPFGKEYNGNA